jgi:hypothetical protein
VSGSAWTPKTLPFSGTLLSELVLLILTRLESANLARPSGRIPVLMEQGNAELRISAVRRAVDSERRNAWMRLISR